MNRFLHQLIIVFLLSTIINIQLAKAEKRESTTAEKKTKPHMQSKTVSGTVTDQTSGETLPGVNIKVKGTSISVTTNESGNYSIKIPDENSTLIFSFIGYVIKEMSSKGKTTLNVTLSKNTQRLEEVVVVGFGKQKVKNLTASISVVNSEALANRPITNASQALQGVQGVYVNQAGGQPGGDAATIRIRGVGSIGGSGKLEPLVLVDGIEYPIGDVSPSDIESISVLKDASSTAIYGSRAANGVILITTKKGKEGKLSINYSSYFGTQKATYLPDPVDNSADYMELYNRAQVNQGTTPYYSNDLINEFRTNPTSLIHPNTNWMNEMFSQAPLQEHSLQFSGGNKQSNYNLSLRYLNQDGVLMSTGSQVYTANLSVQSQVTKRLNIQGTILASSRNRDSPVGGVGTAMNRLMRMIPLQPVGRLENGDWPDSWVATPGQNSFENPIIRASESYSNLENNRILGILTAKYDILKGLSFQTKASVNHRYSLTTSWDPLIYLTNVKTGLQTRPWSAASSTKSHSQNEDQSLTFINTLDYSLRIGNDHSINAVLGTSLEKFKQKDFSASVQGFSSVDLQELSLGTLNPAVSGSSVADVLMSYFGRVQYAFKDRYLFELSSRYDGSSRFSENKRWGFFPSFSLGWRIKEESFMQSLNWISDLKIRGSWGQIGNQEIGRFQYINSVNPGYDYPFGGNIFPGAAVTQSKDPYLTWETTTMTNIGLDWELFGGRLFGVVDVFRKRTDGILRAVTLPAQVGDLTGPTSNVAVVDNNGFEIGLNHKNKINNNLSYEVGINYTKIKNKVKDLKGESIIANNRITKEGLPIDSWYVYKTDGLFQTTEEVNGYPKISNRVGPGDIKYVDLNNDGVINGNDRYVAGNTFPDYTFGFNLGLTYKQFQLKTIWQGVTGIDIYPDHNMAAPFNNGAGLTKNWMTDSWTPENPGAALPRITSRNQFAAENFSVSDFWLQDASYLRMKNVQISYRFTGGILNKIGINKLEIFANGQNLLTFSPMKMWDPETDILLSTSSSTTSTLSNYPSVKTYTMGLNISL